MFDLALVIIAATIIAGISGKFKQPLILGYVLAGILIGPVLSLVSNTEPIKILSELGIALLLFIIGLELDLKRIKQVGLLSSLIGTIQVIVTAIAGYAISLLLGFNTTQAVYIGIIISFSSTMIVTKLLGEQKELESLHGELVLGILIVQDILAVIALTVITGDSITSKTAPMLLLKMGLLLIASYILYRILPVFLEEAVQSTELIFISALTTMFVFASISQLLIHNFQIGAFMAGVALSTTRFHHEITGRVKPLKDFFLVMFFVTLGMQMVFSGFQSIILPLAVLMAAVLIIKPLLIYLIVKRFKYSNRTSFFAGAQLAQVGEFSLVLAASGMLLDPKNITQPIFSMLIVLTITTMVLTAYVIKYDDWLYSRIFSKLLIRLGKDTKEEYTQIKERMRNHIVIFGLHRMSERIISALQEKKKKFVVVDHNPEKVKNLLQRKISCICSDMTNPEAYEQLNIAEARIVISSVHNVTANIILIRKVKQENNRAIVMVASNDEAEAARLYEAGADFVIIPLILGGQKVVDYLTHLKPKEIVMWGKKYSEEIKSHLKENSGKN